MSTRPEWRTENARKANKGAVRANALRAIDDPVKLTRAARIMRAALARRAVTVEDLTDQPVEAPIVDRRQP